MDLFPDQKELKKRIPKVTQKELVLRFFIQQQSSKFKEGWLYYKCQDEGLLDIFKSLQKDGTFNLLANIQPSYPEPKLTIELVPRTSWFSNVRSNVAASEWTKLKKITAKNAQYCCEVCNGKGDRWPVECHEIWDYNDDQLKQTLKGLIALCPSCHSAKHMGFTELCGRKTEITCHLAIINGWSYQHACQYIDAQFETWRQRSTYHWSLDLNWLSNLDISINKQERLDNHYINLPENDRNYYISNRKKAADAFYLGTACERQENFAKAFEYYKESSNYGDLDATYNLAMFYFKGLHVPVDFTIAWEYIEKAASFGDKKCIQWIEPEVKQAIDKKFKEENDLIINKLKESVQLSNRDLQTNSVVNEINITPNIEPSDYASIKEQGHNKTNDNKLFSCKPNNFSTSIITQLARRLKKLFYAVVLNIEKQ